MCARASVYVCIYVCMCLYMYVCIMCMRVRVRVSVCVSGDILQKFIKKASVDGNKHNFMEPYAHKQDSSCLFWQALPQIK